VHVFVAETAASASPGAAAQDTFKHVRESQKSLHGTSGLDRGISYIERNMLDAWL